MNPQKLVPRELPYGDPQRSPVRVGEPLLRREKALILYRGDGGVWGGKGGGEPQERRYGAQFVAQRHLTYSLFTREGIGVPRRELVSVGGSRKTPPLRRTTNGRPYIDLIYTDDQWVAPTSGLLKCRPLNS